MLIRIRDWAEVDVALIGHDWVENKPGSLATPACRRRARDDIQRLRLIDQAVVDGVPVKCAGTHLGLVYKPVVNCIQGEFEAVGDAELIENIVQVVFHGLFGDEELFSDFLVAEALGDELDDFFFAVAE